MIKAIAATAAVLELLQRWCLMVAVLMAVTVGAGTGHDGRGNRRGHEAGVERVQRCELHAGRRWTTSQDEGDRFALRSITVVTGRRVVPVTSADSIIQTLHGIVI